MSRYFFRYAVLIFIVYNFATQLEAVTVNPIAHLCPTNKIAPHRRVARYDKTNPRTFREFYNLLTPGSSSLQERPQEDAPDECGDIEDYDENDVGSVAPQANRRQGHKFNTNLVSGSDYLLTQHQQHGIKPATPPPNRPIKPPPAGYFGNNNYTPPKPQQPTDNVKPVAEPGNYDSHVTYRPGLVGGAIGHIVGLPQKHGMKPYSDTTTPNKKPKYTNYGHASSNIHSNSHTYSHTRPRKFVGNPGLVGSFVDLFF